MKLSQEDIKEINKFRGLFPMEILVKVHRSEDGGFTAEIATFPGSFTQADTISELIDMVNDCIRVYFEIPQQYVSFVPEYLAPIELLQKFGVFPVERQEGDLRLQLAV